MTKLTERVTDLEQKLERERAQRKALESTAVPAVAQGISPESRPLQGHESSSALTRTAPVEAGKHVAVLTTPDSQPLTVGDVKGTFKIPGTDTSLGVGGYVKLDTIYNSKSAGSNRFADQLYFAGFVPLRGEGENSQTTFSPRETRFWFKSHTPTSWGDINTYLEMDFYAFQTPGDQRVSNSYAPRLRHAYGSFGRFLAGQTWSTFMNVAALPELLDFGAPAGRIFVRQPLLRWTEPFTIGTTDADFRFALEQPESVLTAPNGDRLEADDDRAPDVVARFDLNAPWGLLSLAGMSRQIRYSEGRQASVAWGGAVSVGGRINAFERDNFSFHASFGNVLGRYTSFNAFNDGVISPSGQVHLVDVFAGFAAYQHWWSATWRSTVAYGYAAADNPGFSPGTVNDWVQSAHANLLWSPFVQTTFGLEYLYATRTIQNGDSGDLQRVMFSSKFNF